MVSLAEQTAVITGASRGIGKAIALGLATQGVKLCLLGRKIDTLEEVAKIARSSEQCVKNYQVDLTLDRDIIEFADQLKRDGGRVHILIHSAGIIAQGKLADAPVEDFDQQYRVNVHAPYVLTQALLPVLKGCKGQIVFMNSSAGVNAKANVAQYAATKHALKAVADSLREEVNADGIRVLSMFLGRTASPMQEGVHKKEGKPYFPERLMQPEDVAMAVVNALQLPKTAEVTDMFIRPMNKM